MLKFRGGGGGGGEDGENFYFYGKVEVVEQIFTKPPPPSCISRENPLPHPPTLPLHKFWSYNRVAMITLFLWGIWQNATLSHVSLCQVVQDCYPNHFLSKKRIHPNFSTFVKSNLNKICWEIESYRKNLIFDGTGRLNLEMTSYSDNGYDITNYFCCFEKLLAL